MSTLQPTHFVQAAPATSGPAPARTASMKAPRQPAFERWVRTLILWHHRARSRAALRALDDHQLRDVGLDRETAERIGRKPFWQD